MTSFKKKHESSSITSVKSSKKLETTVKLQENPPLSPSQTEQENSEAPDSLESSLLSGSKKSETQTPDDANDIKEDNYDQKSTNSSKLSSRSGSKSRESVITPVKHLNFDVECPETDTGINIVGRQTCFVLSEEMGRKHLSMLSKTSDGLHFALVKLSIINQGLQNIEVLEKFEHIQILEVCHNEISGELPSLPSITKLDLSHNKFTTVLSFKQGCKTSKNLKIVSYASNLIQDLNENNIKKFQFIQELNLSGNKLSNIKELSSLIHLTLLDISDNHVVSLEGLQQMDKLQSLYASIQGVPNMSLRIVHLRKNRIWKLSEFSELKKLSELDLRENQIIVESIVKDLKNLSGLSLLRKLWFLGNERPSTMTEEQYSKIEIIRPVFLYIIPQLEQLDGAELTPEQKVHAANQYGQADAKARQIILKKYFGAKPPK